jgi:hypothetical protein
MATRLPRGSGRAEKAAARSRSSIGWSTLMMPAWRQTASKTRASDPIAPVWLAAARLPARLCPPFSNTTGLLRPSRRALSRKRRPSLTLSR